MMMKNQGIIIANDVNIKRLRALSHNVQRMGSLNCMITNYDARYMHSPKVKVHKILLDAPCTASGKIITSKRTIENWNLNRVRFMSNLQKMLIKSAYNCLEEGGILVYSTCSLEPEENEEVIDFALKQLNLEIQEVKLKGIKTRQGITRWNNTNFEGLEHAIRVWPQDNQTEGFFICRLKKY
jgi:16S rRNA C967 or C1407 C5-methylase (RsmB/RsmF family)